MRDRHSLLSVSGMRTSRRRVRPSAWLAMGLLFLSSFASAQSVPQLINYQGMLTDAAGQPLGTDVYTLKIAIYPVVSDGTALWERTYTNVSVVRGHFNLILGDLDDATPPRPIAAAFASATAYLGVKVGAAAEIAPRQQILSAPYALNGTPAGAVMPFAGSTAPPGWLLCDGSARRSSDYPALFAAIGTVYGNGGNDADPATGFNLPDLRGRVVVGVGTGTDTPTGGWDRAAVSQSFALGQSAGEYVHRLNIDEMPSHNHNNGPYNKVLTSDEQMTARDTDNEPGEPNIINAAPMEPSGGSASHSNIQPYQAMNYIIKY